MRVLIAGHIGLPFGGIATYCESLLASSLSHQIDLCFVETSQGGHDISSRGNWGLSDATSALKNILRFLFVFLHVHPNVVHIMTAQMPSMLKHGAMLLIARSLGARVIIQIHCSVSAMFPSDNYVLNWFSRVVLKQADGILVLSDEWLQIKEKFGKTPLFYIPNGINLAPYCTLTRSVPKNSSEPVQILYLGHLGPQKGILDLIEAVYPLKNQNFIVELVGEPFNSDALNTIKDHIGRYDLEQIIKISPPEFGDQKITRFAAADIFVLPSHSEGMPISIIESMAAGLPTIATTVGAIPEMLVHEKTGLLVPPGNPEALAIALQKLIQSSETRQQMGNCARVVAQEKFDVEHIVPQLLEFYDFVGSQV